MGGDWVDLADQKACAKIIGVKPITAAEASSPARAMGPKPPILSTSAVWEGLFPVPGHWAGEPSARRVPVSCSTRSAEPPRILPRPLLGYPPTRWCKGRPFVGSRISSSESPRNDIGFRIPSCDLGWTGQVYASVRPSDAAAATHPRGLRHEGERPGPSISQESEVLTSCFGRVAADDAWKADVGAHAERHTSPRSRSRPALHPRVWGRTAVTRQVVFRCAEGPW